MLVAISSEYFTGLLPCWLLDIKEVERFQQIAATRPNWNALDILNLSALNNEEKFWVVLREELIPAYTLHDFACWCAEQALRFPPTVGSRSLDAVAAKRAWLRGDISNGKLALAQSWAYIPIGVPSLYAAYYAADASARMAAYYASGWATMVGKTKVGMGRIMQIQHLREVLTALEV